VCVRTGWNWRKEKRRRWRVPWSLGSLSPEKEEQKIEWTASAVRGIVVRGWKFRECLVSDAGIGCL
jgi:hypothetical protein